MCPLVGAGDERSSSAARLAEGERRWGLPPPVSLRNWGEAGSSSSAASPTPGRRTLVFSSQRPPAVRPPYLPASMPRVGTRRDPVAGLDTMFEASKCTGRSATTVVDARAHSRIGRRCRRTRRSSTCLPSSASRGGCSASRSAGPTRRPVLSGRVTTPSFLCALAAPAPLTSMRWSRRRSPSGVIGSARDATSGSRCTPATTPTTSMLFWLPSPSTASCWHDAIAPSALPTSRAADRPRAVRSPATSAAVRQPARKRPSCGLSRRRLRALAAPRVPGGRSRC
jgi:hypothetical protein